MPLSDSTVRASTLKDDYTFSTQPSKPVNVLFRPALTPLPRTILGDISPQMAMIIHVENVERSLSILSQSIAGLMPRTFLIRPRDFLTYLAGILCDAHYRSTAEGGVNQDRLHRVSRLTASGTFDIENERGWCIPEAV